MLRRPLFSIFFWHKKWGNNDSLILSVDRSLYKYNFFANDEFMSSTTWTKYFSNIVQYFGSRKVSSKTMYLCARKVKNCRWYVEYYALENSSSFWRGSQADWISAWWKKAGADTGVERDSDLCKLAIMQINHSITCQVEEKIKYHNMFFI
jgi:hypothetical protein